MFVGISTGGTACGIGVGNYLNGSKLKYVSLLDMLQKALLADSSKPINLFVLFPEFMLCLLATLFR